MPDPRAEEERYATIWVRVFTGPHRDHGGVVAGPGRACLRLRDHARRASGGGGMNEERDYIAEMDKRIATATTGSGWVAAVVAQNPGNG